METTVRTLIADFLLNNVLGKYYPFRQPLQEGTALYDLVARVRSEAK